MKTLLRRAQALELIDEPAGSTEELAESFGDIALINRHFGGSAVALSVLRHLKARSLLDVAAGMGDIAYTVLQRARRDHRVLSVVCIDNNPQLVELARRRYAAETAMHFTHADGCALPFDDRAFDVAMCNLAFHHFAPDAAVALLREMRRVSRITPVVTDLVRSELSFLAAWLFSRIFTTNRLTRHDAPLSALRAYTEDEAIALSRLAGWKAPHVRRYRLIRMVLTDDALL